MFFFDSLKRYALLAFAAVVVLGAGALCYRYVRAVTAEATLRTEQAEAQRSAAVARADDLRASLEKSIAAARAANEARERSAQQLAVANQKLADAARRITRLDGAFRVLHDAAADGCGAPADCLAGGRDADAVDPQALAETIVENYRRAEANRQQLIRLQQFVQGLEKK